MLQSIPPLSTACRENFSASPADTPTQSREPFDLAQDGQAPRLNRQFCWLLLDGHESFKNAAVSSTAADSTAGR